MVFGQVGVLVAFQLAGALLDDFLQAFQGQHAVLVGFLRLEAIAADGTVVGFAGAIVGGIAVGSFAEKKIFFAVILQD